MPSAKITVEEIMTPNPVVLHEWENLEQVATDFKRHAMRHLPVVSEGKLVGLVTHRDLLATSNNVLDRSLGGDARARDAREKTFIRSIMTEGVQTVKPTTPIREAAHLLVMGRFGCLPVVDGENNLVGIVTESDFLDYLVELLRDQN